MLKKNNLILILIVLTILISGCNISDLTGEGKQSGFTTSKTKSSDTGGVQLSFSENNPPSKMYNDQKITFGFIFTNNQKHEVNDLKIKVSGYDENFVSGLKNSYSVSKIPKATEQSGPGVYAGLVVDNVEVNDFSQTYNFNPKFNYCYTAKSTLVEQVCIPSLDNNKCEVDITKNINQNGPIVGQITNIINKGDGGKIRIFFSLANKGDGKVVNECFKEDYANSFTVSANLGTSKGDCESVSGEFNIINNKANFYCDFSRSNDGSSYSSQANLEIEYLYEQSIKKEILVKSLDNN